MSHGRYTCKKSNWGGKTVVLCSYLHTGIPCTGKSAPFCQINDQYHPTIKSSHYNAFEIGQLQFQLQMHDLQSLQMSCRELNTHMRQVHRMLSPVIVADQHASFIFASIHIPEKSYTVLLLVDCLQMPLSVVILISDPWIGSKMKISGKDNLNTRQCWWQIWRVKLYQCGSYFTQNFNCNFERRLLCTLISAF